jgi:choline-sulfatase
MPARVSLATGRYPHNTGVWNNFHYDMPADTPTWMQAIRNAGYRTSLFGKTHLHHHQGDLRDREHLLHAYGLDDVDEIGGPRASAKVLSHMTERWEQAGLWEAYKEDYRERFATKPHMGRPSVLPLEEYADVYVGQQSKAYLKTYSRSEPWFCWVSFGGPHEPWDAPEPYASMYNPADMPKPVSSTHGDQCLPKITPEEVSYMRANYAGNVSLIDDQIGQVLQTIEARGELDNTVIVFTSDHGEMNGDHGLIYKSNFMNGAVRVPLLVRTPRTLRMPVAGTVSHSLVEMFDVGPTLVELAGGKLSHQQFAKSLCPELEDRVIEPRDYAISEIHGKVMYMDHKWKLVLDANGLPCLLFDLENDPDEQNNLVDDVSTAKTVVELRIRIQVHLIKTQVRL